MNEIYNELDELIELIKNTDVYQEYLSILNQMGKSEDINRLVKEIKELQQQAVRKEYKERKPVDNLNKIIEDKINELNNIPLYHEYKYKAEEIYSLLSIISDRIQTCIDEIIPN